MYIYFPFFSFCMLIYDKEYETKGKKIEPRIKLSYTLVQFFFHETLIYSKYQ